MSARESGPETGTARRAATGVVSLPAAGRLPAWLPRPEDVALAGWVAVAVPALTGTAADPFAAGGRVDGLLGLAGILGVAVCVAARRSDPGDVGSAAGWATIGPFVGGLLFVAASSATALGLSARAALVIAALVLVVAAVARVLMPPVGPGVRRTLVTPYVLVAGGLFSAVVDGVTAHGDVPAAIRAALPTDGAGVLPTVGFLVAFSAVCYAMLVVAPRRIAEPEGGLLAWLLRYALFVAGVAIGAGWPALLGG